MYIYYCFYYSFLDLGETLTHTYTVFTQKLRTISSSTCCINNVSNFSCIDRWCLNIKRQSTSNDALFPLYKPDECVLAKCEEVRTHITPMISINFVRILILLRRNLLGGMVLLLLCLYTPALSGMCKYHKSSTVALLDSS